MKRLLPILLLLLLLAGCVDRSTVSPQEESGAVSETERVKSTPAPTPEPTPEIPLYYKMLQAPIGMSRDYFVSNYGGNELTEDSNLLLEDYQAYQKAMKEGWTDQEIEDNIALPIFWSIMPSDALNATTEINKNDGQRIFSVVFGEDGLLLSVIMDMPDDGLESGSYEEEWTGMLGEPTKTETSHGAQYLYWIRDGDAYMGIIAENQSGVLVHAPTDFLIPPYDYKMTAKELYGAYEENGVAADGKYKGKKILVSGEIGSIDRDILGSMYVTLEADSYGFSTVQCYFDEAYIEQVSRLKSGQKISVIGTCAGNQIVSVALEDCQVYEP